MLSYVLGLKDSWHSRPKLGHTCRTYGEWGTRLNTKHMFPCRDGLCVKLHWEACEWHSRRTCCTFELKSSPDQSRVGGMSKITSVVCVYLLKAVLMQHGKKMAREFNLPTQSPPLTAAANFSQMCSPVHHG